MNKSGFIDLKSLTVNLINSVAHIELCRADSLNSLDKYFWEEFPYVIQSLEQGGEARVLVVSSQGKHFTAGMDLDVFKTMSLGFDCEPARRAEHFRRGLLKLQKVISLLENVRMPVIIASQGGCIGGGVDLACAADFRYCTSDAYFSVKEIQLGMAADLGTLQRIQHLLPKGLARELCFSGRNMEAQEALNSGFVNGVYETKSELIDSVLKLAKDIASYSPVAIAGTKEMLNYSIDHTVRESLNYMATWQAGMFHLEDTQEVLNAMKDKRPPSFQNLKPSSNLI